MPGADAERGLTPSRAPNRASVTAVGGVLAAVGLVLLLGTWAATIGPRQVLRGEGNPPAYPSPSISSPTASPSPPSGDGTPAGGGQHDVLFTAVTLVAVVLASILLLAVLLAVVHWLLTRTWRREPPEPEPEEVDFDPIEAPALLAQALTAEAASHRGLLIEGHPRNAIVACWHRFEESAAAAGVRRRPWETSSEFTIRVLDAVSADSTAVRSLGDLYRDARYSTHDLTEVDRTRAIEALDVIHDSLGVRVSPR